MQIRGENPEDQGWQSRQATEDPPGARNLGNMIFSDTGASHGPKEVIGNWAKCLYRFVYDKKSKKSSWSLFNRGIN